VVIAAEAFLKSRGLSFGVEIAIARNLPISGGLGGSAAASVAGALGAAIACGVEYRQSEILHAALEGETAVAGRHLDNIAPCLLGGLAMVLSNSPPAIHPLPIKTKWWLALLTPNLKLETKLSRGVLPASLPTGEWTTILSRTIGLATAFASGDIDLFRSCFVDSFAEPRRSKLIPNFSAIKHAALSRGAIGCTISGAGPTIVAVCETEAIAHDSLKSMKDASPTHSFSHIGQCGGLGAREI
jgi:homoserine kinase